MPSPIYALQASFTAGEISQDVANRVDLDKFQSALLKAQNVYIKPYGGVVKRGGTTYVGETKFRDKKSILVRFNYKAGTAFMLEVGDGYIRVWRNGTYSGIELTTPFTESDLQYLRFNQSADTMFICSRVHPVQVLKRNSETEWSIQDFVEDYPYFDASAIKYGKEPISIKPSAISGKGVVITAQGDVFDSKRVGGYIKLYYDMPSSTVSQTGNGTSSALKIGESWKIITHGTWAGSVTLQTSENGTAWKEYRKYTSSSDYNVTESGSFDKERYLRVVIAISGGSCTADITCMPYTSEGYGRVVEYVTAKQIKVDVIKEFGETSDTDIYAFSVWSDYSGYPSTSCFFQDRLVLASSEVNPHVLWMSRTGDYYNFGVEKAAGTVTDDSAIQLNLISREIFDINHLVPSQDLIVLTNGNEWVIKGSEVITPNNSTPQVQTARGSNECEPQYIGNRTIYVQRRGSKVRDMGYTFESDNYAGDDLTQLADHLVSGYTLVDSAFMQDPYSIVYFVRNDGKIICLTYIREQKVFAWSVLETNGSFESVANVPEGDIDAGYVVVRRMINGEERRYIELLSRELNSADVQDYCMSDCAKRFEFSDPSSLLSGMEHLAGETVQILADGRRISDAQVGIDGTIQLPVKAQKVTVGLGYVMRLQTPNVEIQQRDGTLQGRKADVTEVVLMLQNSLGLRIGSTFDAMDDVGFDEFAEVGSMKLYSGEKNVTVPNIYKTSTKVCLEHNMPFPFALNAAVRVVSVGG